MAQRLTIDRPSDGHLHLRDGAGMAAVVAHSARVFSRAVVMPNLSPPVVTVDLAAAYRERILAALPSGSAFEPLMTLYLTDSTRGSEIRAAKDSGFVVAAKLYPAGATTHSDRGVTGIDRIAPVLAELAACGLPLLVHGEVADPAVDIFDRERVFVDRVLAPLVERWPDLKVVLEHVSTREGVQFVSASSPLVAATVTPQHLLLDVNDLLAGGVRPHHYCLPVLKSREHRQAVTAAATSDSPKFFLGTDSAPHPRSRKECGCGAAGVFSAHAAIELYAEAFEAAGALDRLAAFATRRGPDFYGLPRAAGSVTLVRQPWRVPASYPFGDDVVVPLRAGETVAWRVIAEGEAQ
ncbi:MAG TPA: dihydroorotase [Thermoanaerobaculales bacterium]|nr:dihydroorotase [Thermoanaerobaculales bacterium]HPA80452.1 dihydroorotase [Thermoanaerobaculales bacterium]HQL30511.1 dihydroorotase [Thermoanaerobaculales bacterium]HQN95198.1 dihydroorotase [Thermoanaerobaculales bacterium]